MKVLTTFLLVLTSLFLISCKKTYDQAACEDLSIRKYKGVPRASHQFDENCSKFKIHYTQSLCQKALGDLMSHGHRKGVEVSLKSKYGKKVMECFTGDDLRRFLKD